MVKGGEARTRAGRQWRSRPAAARHLRLGPACARPAGHAARTSRSGGSWTLLTGHGHVLVEIARNPRARIRDISAIVGLANRTVQAIVADLETAGYLTRTRRRRTRYSVNHDSLFRHPAQKGHRVGRFLTLLADRRAGTATSLGKPNCQRF